MDTKIKGRRIDSTLGQNELREYLANKDETSAVKLNGLRGPKLEDCGKSLGPDPRVLLIAPPITVPQYMLKRCIPPLGLTYIAGSLEEAGFDVSMLDCTVEGYDTERVRGNLMTYGLRPEELRERVLDLKPDVIGMSVLFSTDLHNLFEAAKVVKETLPDSEIVVGGLHPSIYPKEIFELDRAENGERTIDWIIRGEGERRMIDFLNNMKTGKVDRNADGLAGYIKGEFFCNHQRATIDNLDELPFPAYHLLPMEEYFRINVPFSPVPKGDRVSQILVSRGCPIGCTFCASTNLYKQYRHRSVENVMQEITQLKNRYDIDELQFADDNLTLIRNFSEKFFTALRNAHLSWCTPNGTMINTLTPELMDLMAESGLYQITLSLDSGNAKTLKNLHHKPCDLNSIPGLIAKAKEYGIFTHGTVVVGMPNETIEDIKEGFAFIQNELELTSISVFIANAIPGSELYHQALDDGLISRDDARSIDTTRAKISLSDIDGELLENMVMNFMDEYIEMRKRKDPEEYDKKYNKLIASGKLEGKGVYGGRIT